MENKEPTKYTTKEKALIWLGVIFLVIFIVCAVMCVFACISTLIHHIRNPELTIMQVTIWNWQRYWVWYVIAIADYFFLIIYRKKIMP